VALAQEIGVAFLFAPLYHPGFRHTGPVRRELGVPTAFNFLGPLTNPTRPSSVAAGVADPRMGGVLAEVLAARGNSALVFHGGGLDELTTTGPSAVWVVANGAVAATEFDPLSVGLPRALVDDLRGGDATRNADVVRAVLAGEPGPVRDIVLLNAAAAIAASEGLGAVVEGYADAAASGTTPAEAKAAVAEGLRKVLEAGIARAAEAVDSGTAAQLLERWAEASHRLAIPGPR
jgi:anthranilate phosphoribosyltransferase